MKVNDAGLYVSDDDKWVWDGAEWLPNTTVTSDVTPAEAEDALMAATSMGHTEAEDAPTPERTVPTCAEQDCLENAADYVRIAMQGVIGSITVEVLLCTMHIATMEMGSQGQFLFIRPRNRLDLNGR